MKDVQFEDSVFTTKFAVYHLTCFRCYKCHLIINKTEDFHGIVDNIIYCKTHYKELAAGYAALNPPPPLLPMNMTDTSSVLNYKKLEEENTGSDLRKTEAKKYFPCILSNLNIRLQNPMY